jgi:hypothetical protein
MPDELDPLIGRYPFLYDYIPYPVIPPPRKWEPEGLRLHWGNVTCPASKHTSKDYYGISFEFRNRLPGFLCRIFPYTFVAISFGRWSLKYNSTYFDGMHHILYLGFIQFSWSE